MRLLDPAPVGGEDEHQDPDLWSVSLPPLPMYYVFTFSKSPPPPPLPPLVSRERERHSSKANSHPPSPPLPLPGFGEKIPKVDGTTVYDVLEKGLDDLMDLCDVVTGRFTEARDRFGAGEGEGEGEGEGVGVGV